MKRSRKLILVLTVTLLVAVFTSVFASAHTFTDMTAYSNANTAVDVLSTIGVIRGTSATTYNPGDNVQRWQMALLISKLITGDTVDDHWFTVPAGTDVGFTDIEAYQYMNSILYANRNSIIIGDGQGHFNPTDGIILQDAVTMVVRALGYPRAAYDASYPQSYLQKGIELGLLSGMENVSNTAVLNRAQTAMILYNAFTAKRYEASYTGTIAEDVFKYVDGPMVLTATSNLRINANVAYPDADKLTFSVLKSDGTFGASYTVSKNTLLMFAGARTLLADPDACIGASYNVSAANGLTTIFSFTANKTASLTSVAVSSNTAITVDKTTYTTVSKYSYELKEGTVPSSREMIVYGFGEMYSSGAIITAKDMASYAGCSTIRVFDDNGDGYYDRAIFTPYCFGTLGVKGNTITVTRVNGSVFTVDRTVATLNGIVPTDGAKVLYSYVSLGSSKAILDIYATTEKITGTVVSYNLSATYGYSMVVKLANGANVTYMLGDIAGVSAADLAKKLTSTSANAYVGANIEATVYGTTILDMQLTDGSGAISASGDVTLNNIVRGPAVVVTAIKPETNRVDTSAIGDGSACLDVSIVDGVALGDKMTLANTKLALYDFVQYSFINTNHTYSISRANPVFTAIDDNYYFSINSEQTTMQLFHINADKSEQLLASFPMSNTTIFRQIIDHYLGSVNMRRGNNNTITISIAKGSSVYMSYGAVNGSTVEYVYVRPSTASGTPVSGTISTSTKEDNNFIGVVYIGNVVIAPVSGMYTYVAVDLSSQSTFYIKATVALPTAGYYKYRISQDNTYYVSDANTITSTVTNTAGTVKFMMNTTFMNSTVSGAYLIGGVPMVPAKAPIAMCRNISAPERGLTYAIIPTDTTVHTADILLTYSDAFSARNGEPSSMSVVLVENS